MNDDSKSEFEKLLEDSEFNIENILEDKNDIQDNMHDSSYKKYIETNISHKDLYMENNIDVFVHKKFGIQDYMINNIKKLKYSFKDREILNLHGYGLLDAEKSINMFLKTNLEHKARFLLIIHGKGLHNKNSHAPMKNLVESFIIESKYILAAHTASADYGGSGAVVLLIKR